MKCDIDDFIGVFDDVFEKEYCDSLINAFEVSAELNKTVKRVDNGYTPKDANNTMYFLADDLFARQQTSQTRIKKIRRDTTLKPTHTQPENNQKHDNINTHESCVLLSHHMQMLFVFVLRSILRAAHSRQSRNVV